MSQTVELLLQKYIKGKFNITFKIIYLVFLHLYS